MSAHPIEGFRPCGHNEKHMPHVWGIHKPEENQFLWQCEGKAVGYHHS